MKIKITRIGFFIVIFSLIFQQILFAQNRNISGTVTSSEDASALPGVSIVVKGTTIGTTSGIDGTYKMSIPDTAKTLKLSFVGMATKEVQIGSSDVIDVELSSDVQQLKDVVITALGIPKKARSLTYSTQEISGSELTQVKDVNMMNSLTGKSAGVVISQGGSGVGSSAKIILRGNKSISGNNEPLYVINGVPMSAINGSQPGTLYSSFDGGDAISNLNPDDIESINVLKGASAAALYGSAAANGVILIKTKKGKAGTDTKHTSINVGSSLTFEKATQLPKIQTKYGQKVQNKSTDSWGPSGSYSNGAMKDFFNTGMNWINSISLANGNDLNQFRISYANTQAKGILPTNELQKHNVFARETAKMFDNKLTLDVSFNFIYQNINNRPSVGLELNPLVGVYLFPTGDSSGFKSYKVFEVDTNKSGKLVQNWPYMQSAGYSSQNPYWVINRNLNTSKRNRSISAFTAKYEITNWLNVQGRINYDRTGDVFEQLVYAGTDPIIATENGEYVKNHSMASQLYSDLMLTMNRDLSEHVSLIAAVGTSNTLNTFESQNISSYAVRSGLYYINNFSISNMRGNFQKTESSTMTQNTAFFGTATLGINNLLFLDITGRNEIASTLPISHNSFFYPSVGLSYVLSESIGKNDVLTFAKLRGSYSQVGNALPFGVADKNPPYGIGPNGSIIPRNSMAKGDLVPERTSSMEFGFDSRFLKDRLNLNFTYYSAVAKEQFFTILAPAGSGAQFYYINGGDVKNSGVEIELGYNMISNETFKWTSSVNMSKNVNKVLKMSDKLKNDQVIITTYTQAKIYQTVVKKDGSFGDIWGSTYSRDASGKIKIDKNGAPIFSTRDTLLGNPNPKILLGWNNTFEVKGIRLSFLIDGRFGGKVVSFTDATLDAKGLSQRTASSRDAGKVVIDGTTFEKPEVFYTSVGNRLLTEQYLYDASNIRLREVSLGYSFNKICKGIEKLTISVVGRNLFFISKKAPFDPEVALSAGSGLQGLHSFNLPSTRVMGISVNIAF